MTYFKLFKEPFLNEPDDISGNSPEFAEPGESDDIEDQESDEVIGEEESSETGEKESEAAKPIQSPDDNAKYAAARREAEARTRQAEERAAKLERDNRIAKEYGKEYGMFSEEDIRATYDMSFEEFEQAVLKNQMAEAGIPEDVINKYLDNHPVIKKANEIVKQTEAQRAKDTERNLIDELHKEVPGADHIKSFEDLAKDPKAQDIVGYMQKGIPLFMAYEQAYKNEIAEKRVKAAQQRQLNNINGKAHIKSDGASVDIDGVTFDPDEFKFAQQLTPGLTKTDWLKFKKSQK